MPRVLPLRALPIGLCLALAAACRTPAPARAPAPEPPAAQKPPPRPPKRPPQKLAKKRPKPVLTPIPKATPAPLDLSFLGSPSACTIILGGATLTAEEGIEIDFAQANGVLAATVADRLAQAGFAVEPLVVFTRDPADRSRTVAVEATRRRCNKMVQVSHFLHDPSYGFLVNMLTPQTDAFDPSRDLWRFHWVPMPYTRRYAYRFTEDAIFSLDLEEVADEIARELAASGLLGRAAGGKKG